jgi:phosphoglucomutase
MCAAKLFELFQTYGAWQEDLINFDLVGEAGSRRIAHVMKTFREAPPKSFLGLPVVKVLDHKLQTQSTLRNEKLYSEKIQQPLPVSDVLQFLLSDGSKISMRPSGTEPKLKIYTSVCTQLAKKTFSAAENAYKVSRSRIEALRKECVAQVEGVK